MRLPKRGFRNIFARDYAEVNIGAVQKAIDAGKLEAKGTLDQDALEARACPRRQGRRPPARQGRVKAKLAIKVAGVSKGAREAVEKAGGSIELIERRDPAELAAAKKGKVREEGWPTRRRQGRSLSLSLEPDRRRGDGAPYERRASRGSSKDMASAAEHLASSISLANFSKATELKKRLWLRSAR